MIAHAIVFYIFSFIAIISAIMVTVSRNTVHSVFFLILDFISISCLFIMIGAEFLGMIMLIVYVGAVAVLFLFVVMMLNVAQQKNEWFNASESSSHIPIGLLVSLVIFFELIIVIGGWKYKPEVLELYFFKCRYKYYKYSIFRKCNLHRLYSLIPIIWNDTSSSHDRCNSTNI